MPTRPVEFSDLKIEDIRGSLYFDDIASFVEKTPQIIRALRQLGMQIRQRHGWRGPITTDCEDLLDPSKLKELAERGAEGADVAKVLLAQRDKLENRPRPIVMKCEDPEFLIKVNPDAVQFLFDSVQSPDAVRQVLESTLNEVVQQLQPPDLKKFGIRFRHIFLMKTNEKNVPLLGKTVLPGLCDQGGFYRSFGENLDWRRADLAWVFYRRNSELVTQVKLEAPGNESNTTIWFSVDTQTAGEILNPEEISNLRPYFQYYEEVVNGLLQHVFSGSVLDTYRREMMVDQWFCGDDER